MCGEILKRNRRETQNSLTTTQQTNAMCATSKNTTSYEIKT